MDWICRNSYRNESSQWLFRICQFSTCWWSFDNKSENGSSRVNQTCYEQALLYSVFLSVFRRGWPIGFLVREVLESTSDYSIAVEQLAQSSLIAPCYFTICGVKQSQTFGTLLTRRQTSEEKRYGIKVVLELLLIIRICICT